ncbi:hypothetical protein LZZ85_21850 [Terrimonas sp. NA20]|uniref:Uncharacterized protein n=1 Tax=Terrimonas ginsenosidimutans TaxID=2908004 RepID=A0ABS9KX84_9BACT|nr:hypothetical protein [Terrimonas ginsenosidimutans]MCG2616956.1 hypothetical protein [Terrimonas ginsenosidimutans]
MFIPSKELVYEYTPGEEQPIIIRKGKIEAETFKYVDRIEEQSVIIKMDLLEKQGKLAIKDEFNKDGKYSVYEKVDTIKTKVILPENMK